MTGTASSPSDYLPIGNFAVIPAGQNHVDIVVTPVDDTTPEPPKTFSVMLSNPVNATILDNQGQGTITDSDAPVGATMTPGANFNASNLPGFQSEVSIAVNPTNPRLLPSNPEMFTTNERVSERFCMGDLRV